MNRFITWVLLGSLAFAIQAQANDSIPKVESQILRSKSKRADQGGDFDDKKQFIVLTLKTKNREFEPLKGLVWEIKIVGEIMSDELRKEREEAFIVLDKQKMTFDLEVRNEVSTQAILVTFDESNAARRGARYEGYISTLYDSQKRIISRESDKRILNKDLERAADLPVMKPFNKDLELMPKLAHTVKVTK